MLGSPSRALRITAAVRRVGPSPLALLAATAETHPRRVAWRDAAGQLTYAEVVRDLRRREIPPGRGPVTVRAADPRDLVLDVVAALAAGRAVAVLGARGGRLAAVTPVRPGVTFLTSGTTGAPRAHSLRSGPAALRPYLGMIGRLPRLVAPTVASPSQPDHGHAFLLVLLTWALSGTYVQATGPVGRVDVLSGVPVQLGDALDAGWCDGAQVVVSGSDVLDPALARRLRHDLGAAVWDAYGATETGPVSLATPVDVAAGTVGRPLPGVTVRERDGVLQVTTAAMRQFLGDRGRIDDAGRLVLTGRADERVVSGGEVVNPERLREWLERLPGVRSARVAVVPDDRFGHRLTATVVGGSLDPAAVRARIREDLGPAHVPVALVVEDC